MKLSDYFGNDIGSPQIRGSFSSLTGGVSITAAGNDIWGNNDQGYFYSMVYEGDFEFVIRVESFTRADLYSKAGIMARESLDPDSKHVFLLTFPDNDLRNNNNGGIEFAYRMQTGGASVAIYPPQCISTPPLFPASFPNVWLKLVRNQNEFQSFFCEDGKEWKPYSSLHIDLKQIVHLGLVVTSHNESISSTANFSHLRW